MRHKAALALLLASLSSLPLPAQAVPRGAVPPSSRCFVVMEEGASAEGDSLFLRKMVAGPELLRLYAPTRFIASKGGIELRSEGEFSYDVEGPQLVARSKRTLVYAFDLRMKVSPQPKAKSVVVVSFSLAELTKGRAILQPAERAIALAAAKSGMSSGLARIVSIEMPDSKSFRAKVALSP